MLNIILDQLGLSDKERVIYQIILEHGRISPTLLARLSKINRTTIYSVAQELENRGLIIKDLGGKTIYYLPAGEDRLETLIKTEHEKAMEKEKSIRELQEVLRQLPASKNFSLPKIRFVDEANLENYLKEATPRWHESMLANSKTWWGFQDHSFVRHFEEWIDWSWKKAPQGIDLKLLTNASNIEQKMQDKHYSDKRMIRFLSSSQFTATQWIVGNYVIYIMTQQRPFYLVEIDDSVIAHNLRELFRNIWERSL